MSAFVGTWTGLSPVFSIVRNTPRYSLPAGVGSFCPSRYSLSSGWEGFRKRVSCTLNLRSPSWIGTPSSASLLRSLLQPAAPRTARLRTSTNARAPLWPGRMRARSLSAGMTAPLRSSGDGGQAISARDLGARRGGTGLDQLLHAPQRPAPAPLPPPRAAELPEAGGCARRDGPEGQPHRGGGPLLELPDGSDRDVIQAPAPPVLDDLRRPVRLGDHGLHVADTGGSVHPEACGLPAPA